MAHTDSLPILRRGILALLVLGSVGLIGELVLLEHYDETQQFIPLVLLALTLASILWHWLDGRKPSLRAFQVVMLLLVIGGTAGFLFHLSANYEFEKELNPDSTGMEFWLEVIRGDMPTLAPGTLIQFGLLGLLYAYRHPVLMKNGG